MKKKNVDEAVAQLCVRLAKQPMLYFSEADLQQLLVEELKGALFPNERCYSTRVPRGKSFHKTLLIHREYGGGNKTRIDVVIFDPKGLNKMTRATFMDKDKKYVDPLYAFELGTEKAGQTAEKAKKHLENDKKKLSRICERGGMCYGLHFFRDITTAKASTKLGKRTKKKILKIKAAIGDSSLNLHKNFKLLGVVLRTKSRIHGSCSIFNGTKWEDVNIQDEEKIKQVVQKVLK